MPPSSNYSYQYTLTGSVAQGLTPTFTLTAGPNYGSASLNSTTGVLSYSGTNPDILTEEFEFTVSDGTNTSDPATVTINHLSDPLYQYAWHLDNIGQKNFASGASIAGSDLNVKESISSGYTGGNIGVVVADEDLELLHEDLSPNIVSGASYDVVQGDNDPTFPTTNVGGGHGTSVAGLAVARGWNNIGSRGVAPKSELAGCNILESTAFSSDELICLGNTSNYALSNFDVWNMSYGSSGTGDSFNFDYYRYYGPSSWRNRVTNLRNGKGGIYVKSSGNGFGSDCGLVPGTISCDQSSFESDDAIPETIVVASLRADYVKSSYSSAGSGVWISGFGGEYGYDAGLGWQVSGTVSEDPAMMTTDRSSCTIGYVGDPSRQENNAFNQRTNPHPENLDCNYTSSFNGTSSAAPTVAGSVALILEANPSLTWRDVKHILASTAIQTDAQRSVDIDGINQYRWITNNAGFDWHQWYGFGVIDVNAAINMAENYNANSWSAFNEIGYEQGWSGNIQTAPDSGNVTISLNLSDGLAINTIEYMRIGVQFSHAYPETVGWVVTSPCGTSIPVLNPYSAVLNDPYNEYVSGWRWITTGVAGFYGEDITCNNPTGSWSITITDYAADGNQGQYYKIGWDFYGR